MSGTAEVPGLSSTVWTLLWLQPNGVATPVTAVLLCLPALAGKRGYSFSVSCGALAFLLPKVPRLFCTHSPGHKRGGFLCLLLVATDFPTSHLSLQTELGSVLPFRKANWFREAQRFFRVLEQRPISVPPSLLRDALPPPCPPLSRLRPSFLVLRPAFRPASHALGPSRGASRHGKAGWSHVLDTLGPQAPPSVRVGCATLERSLAA